jgi:hypothetical protein
LYQVLKDACAIRCWLTEALNLTIGVLFSPFVSRRKKGVLGIHHQPLQHSMSIDEANIMCSPDSASASGQSCVRESLKSIPTPPTTSSSSSSGQTSEAATMNPSQEQNSNPIHLQLHQWTSTAAADGEIHDVSPADLNGNTPLSSSFELELEGTTISSGGTSWTLRLPWLRNKRHRKLRLDDENSSIQTLAPSRRSMHKTPAAGAQDQSSDYYGGLMKTTTASQTTPTFVNVDAGYIDHAPEGRGNYRTTARESQSSRVLQQQRQPQRHAKPTTKQRRRLSSAKVNQKPQTESSLQLDQTLLGHNNTHPAPLPAVTATPAAGSGTAEAEKLLILKSAAPPEPKNINKVFRNRSWISTSTHASNGRRNDMDADSLADFDEAEWTPQDSAYGAAIPVCGWVPKRLRQVIEATLISFAVFVLVYLIVRTSINISEGKEVGSRAHYNDTASSNAEEYDTRLDDDWYVETSYNPNDDDFYNS